MSNLLVRPLAQTPGVALRRPLSPRRGGTPRDAFGIAGQASAIEGVGASAFTIPRPTNTENGNLLLAILARSNAAALSSGPDGWTTAVNATDAVGVSGNSTRLVIAHKVAGSAEPSSYTWTFATTRRALGVIFRIIETAAVPIDVSDSANSAGTGTTAPTSPTLSVAGAGLLFCAASSGSASTGPLTDPAGFDALFNDISGEGGAVQTILGISVKAIAQSGATGAQAWALAQADLWAAASIMVRS